MKKLLSLLILLTKLYAFTAYSQENSLLSPDIWLRSDRLEEHGIYWQDVSGNHRHALSAKKFSMSENLINFHPVISFDGVNDQMKMFYDISHFSRLTVILAFHNTDTISEQGVWSLDAGSKQVSALTNKNLLRASGAVTYPVKKRGIPTVNSSVQSWTKKRNKSNDIMFIVGGAVLADSTASLFKGSIAECLVFDKYLSKDEILKIESYLGIKYGVTLFESDYIASTGDTVWNYRQNRKYSNSIAGIGKDSIFGLNQKQSCSTAGEEELAIAAGKLTASNTSNTFNLKEGAYLLWGHNGGEMAYGQLEKGSIAGLYPVLERRWLVQSKTETDKIPTTLKFKTPENFKDYAAQCMLVIDRSGKGDFSSKAIEYITASKADENGDLYFENIRWDTDNSGTDIFTFSYGNTLEITSVPPLCEDASNGSIDIKIWGGRPPFYFELEDTLTKIRYTRLGKAEQYFTQLPAGFYNISVSDDNDRTLKSALLLEPVETLALNLPGIQLLETGKSIQLDASALHTGTATNYLWTSDNGFNSADALVELTEEGIYELIVQNENACTVKGNFTVKNSSNTISANTSGNSGNSTGKLTAGKAEYKAYPNPSPGFYNIEAILPETSEINIRIFNIEGKLLSEWKDRGKKHYRFNSDINMPGSYIVEFDTPFGKEKIKLIISK